MKSNQAEFYRLEDRVLFEAGAVVQAAEAAAADANANTEADSSAAAETQMESASVSDVQNDIADLASVELPPEVIAETAAESGSAEKVLVVINSSVADANEIVNDLGTDCEVLILEAGTDALDTINDYLDAHADTEYSALHIVSHGNDGYITLNGEKISNDTLNPADWKAIGEHLTDDADILIYGCNTASSDEGKALIQSIADLTGADVAASTDSTGANGDWDLEYRSGLIESATLNPDHYQYSLTNYTFTVTGGETTGTAGDTIRNFATLGDAVADANERDAGSEITITFSDAQTSLDISSAISIGSGNKQLFITIDGDLDNDGTAEVTLTGKSSSRIFTVSSQNVNLTLDGLIIKDGSYSSGGAVYSDQANTTLIISNSKFTGNKAVNSGGAIYISAGSSVLKVINSVFEKNSAAGTVSAGKMTAGNFNHNSQGGGAIYFYSEGSSSAPSLLSISGSTFDGNSGSRGGAIDVRVKSIAETVIDHSVFKNNLGIYGGAVCFWGAMNAENTITYSLFDSNTASGTVTGLKANKDVTNGTTVDRQIGAGGAIYVIGDYSSSYWNMMNVNGATFINNTAETTGGAISVAESTKLNVVSSTIVGNRILTSESMNETAVTAFAINDGNKVYCVGGAGIALGQAYMIQNNNPVERSTVSLLNNIFADNVLGNGTTANDVFRQAGTVQAKYNVYSATYNSDWSGDKTNIDSSATSIYDMKNTKIYSNSKWLVDTNELLQVSDSGAVTVNRTNLIAGLAVDGSFYKLIYSTDNGSAWSDLTGTSSVAVEKFYTDATGYMRHGYYTAGAAQYKPVVVYTDSYKYYAEADFKKALANGGTFYLAPTVFDLDVSSLTLSGELSLQGHINQKTVLSGTCTFSGKDVTLNGLTLTGNLTNSNADVYVTNSLITNGGSISAQDLILANTTVYENSSGNLSATGTMNIVSSTLYNGGTVSAGTLNVLNSIAYNTTLNSTSSNTKYSLIFPAEGVDAADVFGENVTVDGLTIKTSEGVGGDESTAHMLGAIAGYSGTNLYYSTDENYQVWYNFSDGNQVSTSTSIVKLTTDANGNKRLYNVSSDSSGAAMGAYSSATEAVRIENNCIIVTTNDDSADCINKYDGVTSLREAVAYFISNNLSTDTYKITFANDMTIILRGDTERGNDTCAFAIKEGAVRIDGGTNKIVLKIDGNGPVRHFEITEKGSLNLAHLTLMGSAVIGSPDKDGYGYVDTVNSKKITLASSGTNGGSIIRIECDGSFTADYVVFSNTYYDGCGSQGGGVIYSGNSGNSTVTVTNSLFTGHINDSSNSSAIIYGTWNGGLTAKFSNITVQYCSSSRSGSSLFFTAGNKITLLEIADSVITNNNIAGNIINSPSSWINNTWNIISTEFSHNTASGIIRASRSSFLLDRCSIFENTVSGSVINVEGDGSATLTLSNTVIYANSGSMGTIISHKNGNLFVLNSTIFGNISSNKTVVGISSTGGATDSAMLKTVNILNSVIAGNGTASTDKGASYTWLTVSQSNTNSSDSVTADQTETKKVQVYGSIIDGELPESQESVTQKNHGKGKEYTLTTDFVFSNLGGNKFNADGNFTAEDIFGQDTASAWQSVKYKYLQNGVEKEGTKYILIPTVAGWAAHMGIGNLMLSGNNITSADGVSVALDSKIVQYIAPNLDITGNERKDFFYTTIGAAAVQLKTSASMVNSTGDVKAAVIGGTNGVVTLRDAAAYAALYGWKFGESVTFDATKFESAQTITLGKDGSETFNGTITFDSAYNGKSLTIDASTTGGLTLNLNGNRGFLISAEKFTLSLTGMTITGGKVTSATANGCVSGGVIAATGENVNLIINDVIFSKNQMDAYTTQNSGAVIFVGGTGSTVNITDSEFNENGITDKGSTAMGGAIRQDSGTLTITDSVFYKNYVTTTLTGSWSSGGALYIGAVNVTLTNTDFTDNYFNLPETFTSQYAGGGAITMSDKNNSTLTIIGGTFSGNHTVGHGGAIYANTKTLKIDGTEFYNNQAYNGGAIYHTPSYRGVTIQNSIFRENKATNAGGAFYSSQAANGTDTGVVIADSVFYKNSAAYGGALYLIDKGTGSIYQIISTTMAGNTSTKMGGGIFACFNSNSQIYIANSIVLGNTYTYTEIDAASGAEVEKSIADDITFTQEASSTNHKIEARHSIIGTARHGGFGSSITDGFTASANTQKALTNVDGTSKVHAIYDIGSDGKAVLYGTADDTVSVEAVFGKNGPVFNESKQIVEVYKSDLTLSGVQTALAGRAGLYSTDGGTTWYKISDGKTYNGSDTKVILNDVAEINGVKLTGQYAYGSAEELFLNYLVVDSAADNSSADAVVTLREAVEYALKQTGKQTITFAGVTDVITLSSTLDVTGNLTIDCGTGVKVSGELTIDNGAVLTLNGTATLNSFVNNGTLNVTGNLSSTNTKFGNVTYSGTESTQTQTVLAGTYTTLTLSGSNTSKNLGGTVTANELNADSLTIAGGTLIVLAANTPAAPLSTVNNVTFSGVNASNAPLYLNSSNSVTTSAKDIYIVQNGVTASITWNLNNGEYKDSVVYDGTTYTVSASVTAGSTTKTLSFDKTAGATDADTYTYTVKDGTDYTISAEYNGTKYVTIGTNVYALDSASVTSKTFEITKREITIKANSTEKTYNGSAQTLDSYTITSELELADGQTIADGWTFDKSYTNAGTYTDIKVDDNTVKIMDDNTDVTANYDITYAAGTLKIEAQTLSGTISVGNMALLTKTYDGTKKLNTGDLKLTVTDDQGKELTLNYDSAVFNSANVSEAKKITVSGIKLTDSNYTIGDSYEITSGVFINALELDTTAIQAADGDETDTTLVGTDGKISKVYDGTTNVGPLNLTIAGATGQTLTLNHTASFAGKDVVTEGQQINLTGISIVSEGGILASNYILAETGTLDGEITKRDLTLTSESQTWVYDRSEHSCEVVNGEGFVGDEKFTYTDFAVIKDVSTIKNTFEYKDGTALVSNYNVKEEDIYYGTLEVTPKALNVADILIVDETTDSTVVTGSKGSYTITKEYDGTKTVGDLLLLIDVGTGTYLTLDYTAAFDSANVKEVQRVLLTGLAVTEDPNYTLDFTNTEITGVITAKDLTVTAKDNDTAVYNGTEQTLTGAEISGQLSGHYLADGYTFDASYTDAGTYKDIKVSESSVRIEDGDGNDMTGNYNLNFAAGTLTIGKASLSVADAVANNGDAIGKVYDGTTAVDDLTLTIGGVNGTTLTLGYGSAAYNDAGVADADSITVDGIALSADDAKNYELDADTRDYSASISKRSITITAQDAAVVYNGNAQTLTESAVTGGSLAAGQVLTGITYGQGGTNAGSYTVSISDAVITDAQGQNVSANYETAYTDGSLTIGKRAVTVQADSMKVNVSEPPSELTYQIIFGSLAAGDSFSGALKCEGSDAEQPGDYAITQGDLALTDNYILTFIDGTLTVEGGGQNADQSQTGSILNTSVLYTAVAGMTGSASAQTGLPPVFSSTEYQNGSGVGYIFATQHNQLLQTAVRPAEEGRGVLRLSSVLEQKLDRFATAGETVVKDGETAVSDHLNGDFNGQTEEDERYDLNSEDYIFSENPGLDLFTKADLFKDEIDLAIEEMMLA